MALDPVSLVSGIASGIATEQGTKAVKGAWNSVTGQYDQPPGEDFQAGVLRHLASIDRALNPEQQEKNIDLPMALQAYPSEYITTVPLFARQHLSIFFHESTPTRFDIMGIGTYLKTVGPGWVQIDVSEETRISTTDGANHNVIVSYRDTPLGSSL